MPRGDDKPTPKKPKDQPDETSSGEWLIPTGSTLLNLACSDSSSGGFATGKMVNIIGDSSAGKTILALTGMAETCRLPDFDDFRFRLNDAEAALEFDLSRFGSLEDRLEITHSETIEEFQADLIQIINSGDPFVYVFDSLDAVSSDEEQKLIEAGDVGSYKMGKARKLHETFRTIIGKLKKTTGLLIIISQTRDKINSHFPMKYRTGERPLEFYSSHVVWLSIAERIQKGASKNKRQVGIRTRARVSKNRLTGKVRTVEFPIYYDYGVDDIGSMVDFQVEEGFWSKAKQTIQTDVFGSATRDKMIMGIESQEQEDKLVTLTGESWKEVEEDLAVNSNRKARFE